MIEAVVNANSLSKDDLLAAMAAYGEEKAISGSDFSDSVTGIANAFTRAANLMENNEDRYRMQVAGASTFVYVN